MFEHFGPLSGALQRKEMAPTLKTLFYNGKSKVFELRSARFGVPGTFIFIILTHFFCSKVCVSAFWPTFWSATEEGNGCNAQNLVLQWEIKGFLAPPSPFWGARNLHFYHFNTLFLLRSVCFCILAHFLERYRGRKWLQRSKPCFTMGNQRFFSSAHPAPGSQNHDFLSF